ncbi:MAG: hypothetical protein Q8P92_02775 [Candidatus Daviesbacteria bacterium]|nr:hypothetical protein [Candidatus Daviesbacteria bacterium]
MPPEVDPMQFQVDPNVRQSRFDVDPSDNSLIVAEPTTVLRRVYIRLGEYFPEGKPVVGELMQRVYDKILSEWSQQIMDVLLSKDRRGLQRISPEQGLARLKSTVPTLENIDGRIKAATGLLLFKK